MIEELLQFEMENTTFTTTAIAASINIIEHSLVELTFWMTPLVPSIPKLMSHKATGLFEYQPRLFVTIINDTLIYFQQKRTVYTLPLERVP